MAGLPTPAARRCPAIHSGRSRSQSQPVQRLAGQRQRTIQWFSARLRQQLDLDTLTRELLGVVEQTMQPTSVSLWLRPSSSTSKDQSMTDVFRAAW